MTDAKVTHDENPDPKTSDHKTTDVDNISPDPLGRRAEPNAVGLHEGTEAADPAVDVESALAAFRRQLDGQVSVPATVVQDCLLDLWVSLPNCAERAEVERWLLETLQRNVYAVSDVDSRLASMVAATSQPD